MLRITTVHCTTNVFIPCRSYLGGYAVSNQTNIYRGATASVDENLISSLDASDVGGPRNHTPHWPIEVDVDGLTPGVKRSGIYVQAVGNQCVVYVSK